MGLDQYLNKKIYIPQDTKSKQTLVRVFDTDYPTENLKYLEYNVGYWRKANHIHAFFVEHVQNGEDDCSSYLVRGSTLKELLRRCNLVKESLEKNNLTSNGIYEDTTVAEELLPTKTGFFFGSSGYNTDYLQDIIATIDIITPLLDCKHELYYSSSW